MGMIPFRMNTAYGRPLGQVFRDSDFLREYVPHGQRPAKGKYHKIAVLPDGIEVAIATSLHEGGGAALVVHTPSGAKRPPIIVERDDDVLLSLHHHAGGQSDLELIPGHYRVEVGGRNVYFTLKK